ncbi:MAG: alpha/beta hydrolase [Chloroflexi bacterium]|nr:alpha/beta hydrolase [Chloroflexota bacterium]
MQTSIRANDLDIAYEVTGSGPPLVLLHGASTSGRATYAGQIAALAESFRMFMPDARGHGATRWDVAGGFRAGWLVDDLEAFVDALDLRTFHLMGYSMGAMTALGLAVRAPDRLRTLVVAGITTARDPRARVAARLLDPDRIARDDPTWAAEMTRTIDATQGGGSWLRLLPAIAADVASQPLLTPLELRSITAPTLVIAGDRDPLSPVGQVWELSRQVRDGRLLVAPDSGHDVLGRRAALVNQALRDFYRSTESVARARTGPEMDAATSPGVDTV